MNRLDMLPNPEKAVTIYTLPDGIRAELEAWESEGKPPRDFLGHILCNNLVMTLTKMSGKEAKHLEDILQFVNQKMNPECWGSNSNVTAWWKWHKEGKVNPLSVIQMREGLDTKRQVRALQEALNLTNLVVEEIIKNQKSVPDKNLSDIHQKALFALEGAYEASLSLKVGQ